MSVSQAAFAGGLLDGALPAPKGLTNPDGAQASKRFDVYRNNVAASLSDALETAFPVLRKLLGDAFFRAMAGVFLRAHPPKSPLMMHYGADMPVFLKRFEPVQHLPYLPDIARLELAMRQSYHAADAAPIEANILADIAPEALMQTGFDFAPSVRLIRSEFPIVAIYRANTQAHAAKPVMQPECALLTRPAFDPQVHALGQSEAVCLDALMHGATLGEAMTQAGPELDLAGLLGLLLGQNAIHSLNRKGTSCSPSIDL